MFKIKELRQQLADVIAKGKALLAKAEGENRDLTAEEKTAHDAILTEAAEVSATIKRVEAQMEIEREAAGRSFDERLARGEAVGVSVHDRSEDDPGGGFKDHRDFLGAVMNTTAGIRQDPRLIKFQATQGSDEQGVYSDPHGGYLVPETVMPGIMGVTPEQDPLMNLVTPVPMETETVKVNARVDKNHSSSVSGGLTVTRRAETVDGTSSRMTFEQVILNGHELFGFAYASERILEKSPQSFMAILSAGFGDEFAANAINERLNGSGTGEFQGVIEADCTVSVSKQTGQTAATIVKENIDKMAARCWRYGQAVWLANHNTRPQLTSLVQIVGTGGNAVPYFQTTADGRETLDGRPIFFTEFAFTLGTKGDLVLGNWSQYLQGTVHGMRQAESIHVRFLANERAFKFWLMNDGKPWWRSSLSPKRGDTLSPFIVLASRS